MSFAFISVDPYDQAAVLEQQAEALIPIRRPILGTKSSPNVYATLQVLEPNPEGPGLAPRRIFNSSTESGFGDGTANFFLAQIRFPQRERVQVTSTFARDYLYSFGRASRTIQVQGVLLKTPDFPWKVEWLRNYDDYLRATRTLERAARIYLTAEDLIYEGHMLSCEITDSADSPTMCPMSFIMYLTNLIYARGIPRARTEQSEGVGNTVLEGGGVDEDTIHAHTAEYLTAQDPNQTASRNLAPPKRSQLPGQFYYDENGNLALSSTGGITSRSATSEEMFFTLSTEQIIAAAVARNEATGANLDIASIRRALAQLDLAELGYGFGDAYSLENDTGALLRMLDSGAGGYATQLSNAGEAFETIVDDL